MLQKRGAPLRTNTNLMIFGLVLCLTAAAEAKLTAYCSNVAARAPSFKLDKHGIRYLNKLRSSEEARLLKRNDRDGVTTKRSEKRYVIDGSKINPEQELRDRVDQYNATVVSDLAHVRIEGRKGEEVSENEINYTVTLYPAIFTFEETDAVGRPVQVGGKFRLREFKKMDKNTGKFIENENDPIVFIEIKIDDKEYESENVTDKYRLPIPRSQARILLDHEFYRKNKNDYFNAVRRIARNIKSNIEKWEPNPDIRIGTESIEFMLSNIKSWHRQHADEEIKPNKQFIIRYRRKGTYVIIPSILDANGKAVAKALRLQATNDRDIQILDPETMKVIAEFDTDEIMSERKSELGYDNPDSEVLARYPGLIVWKQYRKILKDHQKPEYELDMGKNSARKSATPD